MVDLFFSTARPFALVVNLVLIAITAVAVAKVFLHSRQLEVEETAVRKVSGSLGQDLPKNADERRIAARARILAAARACPRGSLIRLRLDDLEEMGERAAVDMAGLSALNRESLRDALHFPITVAPTLVLLGLLGTLWGLATAVSGLSTTLGATAFSTLALKTSIVGTLGGMKTAFSTTLLGILGSLVVRSITGAAQHRQSKLLRDLERLLMTKLVPLYEVSEATALPDAAASLRTLAAGVEKQGEALTEQLKVSLKEQEEAFNERARDLLEETGKAMKAVLGMLGDRDEGDPSLADYVKTVQAVTEGLERSVATASGMIPKMEDRLQAVIVAQAEALKLSVSSASGMIQETETRLLTVITEQAKALEGSVTTASGMIPEMETRLLTVITAQSQGLEKALTAYSGQIAPILEGQTRATGALVEAAEGSNASVAALAVQLKSLSGSFELARSSWERIDELVGTVGTACSDAISEGLNEVVAKVSQVSRGNEQERERIATALGHLQGTLTSTLDRLHEERGAAQLRSIEILETTREVMTAGLERILDSLRADQRTNAEGFARAIRELARELRDLKVRPAAPEVFTDGRPRAAGFGWEAPAPPDDPSSGSEA